MVKKKKLKKPVKKEETKIKPKSEKVNVKDKIEQGWVHGRAIIEVLGKPKSSVEDLIKNYVKKVKENKNYIIIESVFAKTTEVKDSDNLFSTFVELDFLAKNIEELVWFCFDYMPSSIEIIAPSEFKHTARTYTTFLNEIQTKMHQIDMMLKTTWRESQILKKNVSILIRNLIVGALRDGQKTFDEIKTISGLPTDELKKYLDAFVERKMIKKDKDKYHR